MNGMGVPSRDGVRRPTGPVPVSAMWRDVKSPPRLTQRLDSVAKRICAYQQQWRAASARLGNSAQEYVCRADDFDRAVLQDEAQRTIVIEAAEATADRLVLADMHGQAGAGQMRPLLPGADQRRAFGRP